MVAQKIPMTDGKYVPGRMPALFPFVGGIRCIHFHIWFTQRVCAGHKGQRADSQTIWPITICTMHPFPTLVYTEGVRWTQEAKGRKSNNMADYIVYAGQNGIR